jgi:hypothetical protein
MEKLAQEPLDSLPDGTRAPQGFDQYDMTTFHYYILFHIKRFINKLFFRPASPGIRILANMVSSLRLEVENQLETKSKAAALSSPEQIHLRDDEITDNFDYLRMEDLVRNEHDTFFTSLSSMAAAMAGYSEGLGVNYTTPCRCGREKGRFPSYLTIQLDYSNHSLSGAMKRI